MKKQIHTFILGSFTLFAIYLYYVSATPIPLQPVLKIKDASPMHIETEEMHALNYLNTLRTGAGLLPFQGQAQLNTAARNHADYLTAHLTYGHKENSQHRDFTGEFASSRVRHAGYATSQVIENVSTHNQNYKESVNGLFAAIYHRLAFLDIRSDSIGIGISQNSNRKTQTAFVYDMSSNALEELYASSKIINNKNITNALDSNKKRNQKVIIYPFNEQKDVPPAFYDELPDPLPLHKVSGFPISISFNSFYHKEAKLLKFELFNAEGIPVSNTLIFNHQNDPNKRLEKLDFVLFPLSRLEWNSTYHVKFLAIVDKKLVTKEWSFTTQSFSVPLHVVQKHTKAFKIKTLQSHIFYFPPTSKIDLLHDIAFPSNVDIAFVDKNTIKLTALSSTNKEQRLIIGRHKLMIEIEE